jgi:hypothetical protein
MRLLSIAVSTVTLDAWIDWYCRREVADGASPGSPTGRS